jgi:hypothetical protein
MVKVIIENAPKKHIRPCTKDSNLFIGIDGKLYKGYYLKCNYNTALQVDRIIGIRVA